MGTRGLIKFYQDGLTSEDSKEDDCGFFLYTSMDGHIEKAINDLMLTPFDYVLKYENHIKQTLLNKTNNQSIFNNFYEFSMLVDNCYRYSGSFEKDKSLEDIYIKLYDSGQNHMSSMIPFQTGSNTIATNMASKSFNRWKIYTEKHFNKESDLDVILNGERLPEVEIRYSRNSTNDKSVSDIKKSLKKLVNKYNSILNINLYAIKEEKNSVSVLYII